MSCLTVERVASAGGRLLFVEGFEREVGWYLAEVQYFFNSGLPDFGGGGRGKSQDTFQLRS